MHRVEVINSLIKQNNYKSYLEIGVNDGYCLDNINCINKLGIDPDCHSYRYGNLPVVCMTSNEFFSRISSNTKFDIIFIDGLHLEDQVYTDIVNSIKFLTKGGVIVIHDCYPLSEESAAPENNYGIWNGTVYLGFLKAVKTFNLKYYTVNTDQGCGIIFPENVNLESPKIEMNLNYDEFSRNADSLLKLVSIGDFREMMSS